MVTRLEDAEAAGTATAKWPRDRQLKQQPWRSAGTGQQGRRSWKTRRRCARLDSTVLQPSLSSRGFGSEQSPISERSKILGPVALGPCLGTSGGREASDERNAALNDLGSVGGEAGLAGDGLDSTHRCAFERPDGTNGVAMGDRVDGELGRREVVTGARVVAGEGLGRRGAAGGEGSGAIRYKCIFRYNDYALNK